MAKKKSKLTGLKVLLGVTAGIAAYKAVDLASKLTGAGAVVRCVMTEDSSRLVGAKSFEAVTGRQVYTSLWNTEEYEIGHIGLSQWADVVVVAPATANILGKIANGVCDDLLSTVLCACWQKPVLLAPAMNTDMWNNPAVQWNMKAIDEMGATTIGPETGRLACGDAGAGRMSEPADIISAIEKMAGAIKKKSKKK